MSLNIETANCMLVYKKHEGWTVKIEPLLQVQCLGMQTEVVWEKLNESLSINKSWIYTIWLSDINKFIKSCCWFILSRCYFHLGVANNATDAAT